MTSARREPALPFILITVVIDLIGIGLIIPVFRARPIPRSRA